jgi:N,N-dimethylformamidase beta subunit-like, C-terminal
VANAPPNPVQRENALPGSRGWQIPPTAGTVITGYASETSVAPGQKFHLHVSAPPGSRYRVGVYRLGWYRGVGGRLVMCIPGCRSSKPAASQPPPTTPDPLTGLFDTPWRTTDVVKIPRDALSGYYEAKLEIVNGPDTGAVGGIPLIVRQSRSAAPSAVLIQVPVNTWEAYNPWGGKSLYGYGTSTHATEVSFDRPYDQQEFYDMATKLELPWVQFLEREGVDVSYQTDVDTDRHPASLLRHRLVFAIGHDEYWTQRMRDGFDTALALGTNLMFGSNSGLWRMDYDASRRTIVEWRDGTDDTGFFRSFGEPECQLMAVEYQEFTQRNLLRPATPYTVVGSAGDPWLSVAGMTPGEVIPGVVGYEWDSLMPGCFDGQVVPLMQAALPGSDGNPTTADLVRATAPSGARVLAMGTMELSWALDNFAGETRNPQVVAFVNAALNDLGRPAAPDGLTFRRTRRQLIFSARLPAPDPRIIRVSVTALRGGASCLNALWGSCRLPLPRGRSRYAAVAIDRWGVSEPLIVTVGGGGEFLGAREAASRDR